MWEIIFSSHFKDWLLSQEINLKKRLAAALLNLEHYGPLLPRPYADTVHGSSYHNMKELRIQYAGQPIRVFYAFDPERKAIVLCAGNKRGDKQFYQRMIALADQIFTNHLEHAEDRNT
ncbi:MULTISPECIES: type II toxin-antitoxin system RelE/ParE family toxin [unclassified Pantoea]|uniref:type II toxin-antitoxin system RelE/ParE family toxin n=1 Tax=unclassified Pantoea TaxID=2630326 RepID=UPI000D34329E|nr:MULTISPECIES: type II toxin-antitoxin system RelE/ParE family toxin [unclassified Pantoea]RAU31077.1 type II toxin-antitoxin system RelE/ParE family toxin [Pantoea sp. RIT 413]